MRSSNYRTRLARWIAPTSILVFLSSIPASSENPQAAGSSASAIQKRIDANTTSVADLKQQVAAMEAALRQSNGNSYAAMGLYVSEMLKATSDITMEYVGHLAKVDPDPAIREALQAIIKSYNMTDGFVVGIYAQNDLEKTAAILKMVAGKLPDDQLAQFASNAAQIQLDVKSGKDPKPDIEKFASTLIKSPSLSDGLELSAAAHGYLVETREALTNYQEFLSSHKENAYSISEMIARDKQQIVTRTSQIMQDQAALKADKTPSTLTRTPNMLTFNSAALSPTDKVGQVAVEEIVGWETKLPSTLTKTPGGLTFNAAALTPAEKAGQDANQQIVSTETSLPSTLIKTPGGLILNAAALTPAEKAGQDANQQVVANETAKGGAKAPFVGSQGDPFVQALNQNMTSVMGSDNPYLSELLLKDSLTPSGFSGSSSHSYPLLPTTLKKAPSGLIFNANGLSIAEKAGQAAAEQIVGWETKLPSTLTKTPGGFIFNAAPLTAAEKAGQAAAEQIVGWETKLPSTLTKTPSGLTFNESALSPAEKAGQATAEQIVGWETKLPSTLTKTPGGLIFNEDALSPAEKAGQAAAEQIVGSETKPSGSTTFNESALTPTEKTGQAAAEQIVGSETKLPSTLTKTPSGLTFNEGALTPAEKAGQAATEKVVAAETVRSSSVQDQLFNIVDGDFSGESDGLNLSPGGLRKSSDGTVVARPYSYGNLEVGQGPRTFSYGYTVSDGKSIIGSFVDVIPIGEGIFAAKTDGWGEYRLYSTKNGKTPISYAFAGSILSMRNGKVEYRVLNAFGGVGFIDVSKYLVLPATQTTSSANTSAPSTTASKPSAVGGGGAASPAPAVGGEGALAPRSTLAENTRSVAGSPSKDVVTQPSATQSKSTTTDLTAIAIPSAASKPAVTHSAVSPSAAQQTTAARIMSSPQSDTEAEAIFLNAKQRNQALVVQQQQFQDHLTNLNQQILQTGTSGFQLPRNVQPTPSSQYSKAVSGVPTKGSTVHSAGSVGTLPNPNIVVALPPPSRQLQTAPAPLVLPTVKKK